VSATSPTPATLSPAEDNIASVVASPRSKSSVPDMAFVITDVVVVVDPSARIEVLDNDEVVVSNAALIPADPSNDEDPISLATIVPAPPATVVTDVVVARDDAIVPRAVAPLATPLPADVVAAVDADVLAVVAVVVVDEAAIPDAAVPPIAAERAAAIDPPDVAAILPPESAAVVVVVEVVVAALVAVAVAVAVDAAIPPPSLRATAPPTAAAVVPTTPAAVLVLLVVLTDAKKKGDSGGCPTLSLSLFCCFFADRNEELLLHLEDGNALRNAADFDIHEYAANKRS
jgi:hypothetical protein